MGKAVSPEQIIGSSRKLGVAWPVANFRFSRGILGSLIAGAGLCHKLHPWEQWCHSESMDIFLLGEFQHYGYVLTAIPHGTSVKKPKITRSWSRSPALRLSQNLGPQEILQSAGAETPGVLKILPENSFPKDHRPAARRLDMGYNPVPGRL
jgi:hypothetical protein